VKPCSNCYAGYTTFNQKLRTGTMCTAYLAADVRLAVNYRFIGPAHFAHEVLLRAPGACPARVMKTIALVWVGMAGV
jgi:hypothetical protein